MKPYYDDGKGIVIYNADMREILPQIPSGSIDIMFTDPPYGHNNNDGDLIHRREAALGLAPTAEACKLAGVNFIGIELDKQWCDQAIKCLQQEGFAF